MPARQRPPTPVEPWCDADHEVRRVRTRGEIRWHAGLILFSAALAGEQISIAGTDDELQRFFTPVFRHVHCEY
ncbi:MAG: hypothetical protein AAFR90_09520 [Pseudomonadota bacterium]